MPTNYEKYLAGEPLTPELAALKRGELTGHTPFLEEMLAGAGEQRAPFADAERPLSTEERAALREIRSLPGWGVLQRLLERATINHTNAATLLSQEDPAGKSAELSTLWLTVKCWKNMVMQLNLMVQLELLEQEQAQQAQKEAANGRNEVEPAQQGA